jgi:hypothetical protein
VVTAVEKWKQDQINRAADAAADVNIAHLLPPVAPVEIEMTRGDVLLLGVLSSPVKGRGLAGNVARNVYPYSILPALLEMPEFLDVYRKAAQLEDPELLINTTLAGQRDALQVAQWKTSDPLVLDAVAAFSRGLREQFHATSAQGLSKTLRKYSGALMKDSTIIAILFAATSLLNVFSLIYIAMIGLLFAPFRGTAPRPLVQMVLWPLLSIILGGSLVIQYMAALGWFPLLTFWQNYWPWNQSSTVQYFFGVGLTNHTSLFVPILIALLLSALTAYVWRHEDFEHFIQEEVLRLIGDSFKRRVTTTGSSPNWPNATHGTFISAVIPDSSTVLAQLVNGYDHTRFEDIARDAEEKGAAASMTTKSDTPSGGVAADSGVASGNAVAAAMTPHTVSRVIDAEIVRDAVCKDTRGRHSYFRSSWARLQTFVAASSARVIFILIFLFAALQSLQTLFSAGYLLASLVFLVSTTVTLKGNASFGFLRLYNYVIIVLQVIYQVPFISDADLSKSTCGSNPGICFSWQGLFGLEKYSPIGEVNNPQCVNGHGCDRPLSASEGLFTSVLLFVLSLMQAYVFDSPAFDFVRASSLRDKRIAATRRMLASRLAAEDAKRRDNVLSVKADGVKRRLQRLLHRVNNWESMLLSGNLGSSDDTATAAVLDARTPIATEPSSSAANAGHATGDSSLWPPPAPPAPLVAIVGASEIMVHWSPPRGADAASDADANADAVAPAIAPAMPTDAELGGSGRTSPMEHPSAASSAPNLAYVVALYEIGSTLFEDFRTIARIRHGQTSVVIDRLKPGTGYAVRVAAMNAAGIGPYSPSSARIYIPPPVGRSAEPFDPSLLGFQDIPAINTIGIERVHADSLRKKSEEPMAAKGAAKQAEASFFDELGGYAMRGAEDIENCCGCERGCGGFFDWCYLKVELALLSQVDRLLFPRPVTDFKTTWHARRIQRKGNKPGTPNTELPRPGSFGEVNPRATLSSAPQPGTPFPEGSSSTLPRTSQGSAQNGSLLSLLEDTDADWDSTRKAFGYFSRSVFISYLTVMALLSRTQFLVGVFLLVDLCVYQSVVSLFLPVLFLLYLLWETPRPNAGAWIFAIRYVVVIIILKFVFQLPLFCQQLNASGTWQLTLWNNCYESMVNAQTALKYIQPIALVGITKLGAAYGGAGFFSGCIWDLVLLLTLVLHRYCLQRKGTWKRNKYEDKSVLRDVLKRLGMNRRVSQDLTAELVGSSGAGGAIHRGSLFRRLLPPSWYALFFKDVYSRDTLSKKPGRDLYIWTFLVQFIILLYIVLAYSTMTSPSGSVAGDSVSQQLSANQFSGDMILAVLGIIILMVTDRIAYLYRSFKLKALLQIVSVFVIHAEVFFVIPLKTHRSFGSNSLLIIHYLLWAIYLVLGGLQLHFGFEKTPPRDSLKGAGYNPPMPLIFNLYLAIPFLHELKQLLDWVCTETSLEFPLWMKFGSIHSTLFLTQCSMVTRQRNKMNTEGREAQPGSYKFWCGTLIFGLLLFVIILPALIFSTLNPSLALNNITSASVSLMLRGDAGMFPLFTSAYYASLSNAANVPGQPNYFADLRRNATVSGAPSPIRVEWEAQTQQVVMQTFPADEWQISPPAIALMLGQLNAGSNSTSAVYIDLTYTFSRPGPEGKTDISKTVTQALNSTQCQAFVDAISTALDPNVNSYTFLDRGWNAKVGSAIVIADLYPLAIRLPATSAITALGHVSRTVELQLHSGNNTGNMQSSLGAYSYSTVPLWFTLKISAAHDPFAWSTQTGVVLNVVSDKVAPSFLVNSFGYSVIALYLTVVLAVGRIIRTAFGSPVERIIYEELPDCTELLELCDGVKTAQYARYPNHLVDERHLFRILLRLLRSPEMLIHIGKKKDE